MTTGTNAFFVPDGARYLPTPHARGPWDPNSLHGRVISGLLGRAMEQSYCEAGFQFARLTIDLFRLPPMEPIEVETELIRGGGRIRVADGIARSEGVDIARGRGVLLRRTDQPSGEVWSPPNWDVRSPDEIAVPERPPGAGGGFVPMWETRNITGGGRGPFGGTEQKRAWLRETRELVTGEALTPFLRAALAADFTNPFANSGAAGLNFVNADITLYLQRLPAGEWLGFEVASHQSAEGIAVGESTLYDTEGPIGKSIVCAVANQRRR